MSTCICCGAPIQEGRRVCPNCDIHYHPDAFLSDGTPLYLKTPKSPEERNIQLELYEQFFAYRRAMEKGD